MLENNQTGIKPGPVLIDDTIMMVVTNVITHEWDEVLKQWVPIKEPIVLLRKLEGYIRDPHHEKDEKGHDVHRCYMMSKTDFIRLHKEL